MPKSRNRVISGTYEGKLIGHNRNAAYIILNLTNLVFLTKENIVSIELIDADSDISVPSSAIRGFVGEMLLGPVGLLGAITAKRNERYILGIEFKNGDRSVIEIDEVLLEMIRAANF